MRSHDDAIALLGVDLVLDESCYAECPACGRDGKLSITRTSTGLLYHCFRDACSMRGHVGAVGVANKRKSGKPKPFNKLRPFRGETRDLHYWEMGRFILNNNLSANEIRGARWRYAPDEQCYVFPVFDPHGWERGVVLRHYGERDDVPKARSRMHADGPLMSWHLTGNFDRVILVEDQVSAVRLSKWYTTVALLGTGMTAEGAAELAGVKADNVTIALDADATATAHKLRRWYGLMFKSVTVLRLSKDPKDMSDAEIEEKFECSLNIAS